MNSKEQAQQRDREGQCVLCGKKTKTRRRGLCMEHHAAFVRRKRECPSEHHAAIEASLVEAGLLLPRSAASEKVKSDIVANPVADLLSDFMGIAEDDAEGLVDIGRRLQTFFFPEGFGDKPPVVGKEPQKRQRKKPKRKN